MAKKIIVFTTNSTKEAHELERLKRWFLEKDYPLEIVDKKIRNAKLQGPAPEPKEKKKSTIIPLTSCYASNYTNKNIVNQANILLRKCPDETTREFFASKKVILSHRQPKNLLRQLTSAKFTSPTTNDSNNLENGIHLCNRPNCNICSMYLTKCQKFRTSANVDWEVRQHVTCRSKNVIYFLKCNVCNECTYVGRTNDFRERTNNHISSCRTGNGSDKFDKHVFQCNKSKKLKEPLFKAWIFVELKTQDRLHEFERHLHKRGHDTMNRHVQL